MNEPAKQEIKYPIGIQTFSKLRESGYVYVDKTALVHKLVSEGGYYFLSRPRRFGKSLLISTIEAYFRGRRDLFKGLALDSLTEEWDPHPVLHLDLSAGKYDSAEELEITLSLQLKEWEAIYHIQPAPEATISYRFGAVITAAYEQTGRKVIILIDEYDKPMLSAIEDETLAGRFRDILKSFYGNLKKKDACIKFAMLTGVARFGKLSVFSDLNNLRDITFEPGFSTICGITDPEIDRYFGQGIEELAARYGKSFGQMRAMVKKRYDGYHFAEDLTDIYNPFSLIRVFASNKMDNYWFQGGTPTYIVKLIKKRDWLLRDIEDYKVSADRLSAEGIITGDPLPSLFQAGYLTIRDYDQDFDEYTLGYPNEEVEHSFIRFLIPMYLQADNGTATPFNVKAFITDINRGNADGLMTRLDSLLRDLPDIGRRDPYERAFQNAIYIIFKMIGIYATVENHTSDGRIDLTVETSGYVYLFEFKVGKSAGEAMAQIHRKQYWKKFSASGKTIFLLGVNFDPATNALSDYLIETITPSE